MVRLPDGSKKPAERIALHMVQSEKPVIQALAHSILEARERISFCQNCGGLTERQPCVFCADARRNHTLVCLVERPVDIFSIEKSGSFHGTYHVLGGKISPLNGVEPEDLRIAELEQRCERDNIQEITLSYTFYPAANQKAVDTSTSAPQSAPRG
jgi:recombination protein RecR